MARAAQAKTTLEYVRGERNLSRTDLAVAIKTSERKIESWERGDSAPSPRQFAMLERILGVPDYLLLGETRPNLTPLVVDYRKEHAAPLRTSGRGLAGLFDRLETADTIGLLTGALDEPAQTHAVIPATLKSPEGAADSARKHLDFDATDPDNLLSPERAFRKLRHQVEQRGVFCFFVDVPQVDYRGLLTPTASDWQLCLINKRTFKTKARLFTLAHEYAHVIANLPGASDPLITHNSVEKLCNRFASEFLAPTDHIDSLWREASTRTNSTESRIEYISDRTLLSKGATAYRLSEDDRISRREYQAWLVKHRMPLDYGGEDTAEDLEKPDDRSGGNWAYNVVSDLGFRPILAVERALKAGLIDETDAGRVLNARGGTLRLVFKTVNDRLEEMGF